MNVESLDPNSAYKSYRTDRHGLTQVNSNLAPAGVRQRQKDRKRIISKIQADIKEQNELDFKKQEHKETIE